MDTAASSTSPSVFAIASQELVARMGKPDAPLVLDVRPDARFVGSSHMLAGAQRCAPQDVAALAAAGPPREVVVYCVYGHHVSQDAAAVLRQAGWNARYLAGGLEGGEDGVDAPEHIASWRSCRLPVVHKGSDVQTTNGAAA